MYMTIVESFKESLSEMQQVFEVKHRNYGADNIAHSTEPDEIHRALFAISIRMGDKISRFKSLMSRTDYEGTVDESMIDTLVDLANYAIIAKIVAQKNWKE